MPTFQTVPRLEQQKNVLARNKTIIIHFLKKNYLILLFCNFNVIIHERQNFLSLHIILVLICITLVLTSVEISWGMNMSFILFSKVL